MPQTQTQTQIQNYSSKNSQQSITKDLEEDEIAYEVYQVVEKIYPM
jgi:ribosomal protein S3AE